MANIGDRIELVSYMSDDPDPVEAGTQGVVTFASVVTLSQGRSHEQVGVIWDNGRSLGLICPPDVYAVIEAVAIKEEDD